MDKLNGIDPDEYAISKILRIMLDVAYAATKNDMKVSLIDWILETDKRNRLRELLDEFIRQNNPNLVDATAQSVWIIMKDDIAFH